MPSYPYSCAVCVDSAFEVVHRISDWNAAEVCRRCGGPAHRTICAVNFNGASDWGKVEFNHGLGQWTTGKRDRDEKAKRQGMVEIGNDFGSPEKQIAHDEKRREERRQQRWADALREKVYED